MWLGIQQKQNNGYVLFCFFFICSMSLALISVKVTKNDLLPVVNSVTNYVVNYQYCYQLGYIYGKVRRIISVIAPSDKSH